MNGADVILLDKKSEIGTPKRCAEGVSREGLMNLGIELNSRWITKELNGARLISPNGTEVLVGNNQVKLSEADYILERKVFDKFMAMDAARAGAAIMIKTLARNMRKNDDGYIVSCECMGEDFEIKAKIVIGADGSESRVGRWGGLKTLVKTKNMGSGIQYEMVGVEMKDPDCLEFYFGSIAPGGYAWIFPKGEDIANVGLLIVSTFTNKTAHEHLLEFIKNCPATKNAQPIELNIGGIPLGGIHKSQVSDHLIIVGDAAGQVNPLTGGGIVTALKFGKYAGEVSAAAVKDGDYSKRRLKDYEERCKTEIGSLFKNYMKTRKYIISLSDSEIDSIFTELQKKDIATINSSELIKSLIKVSPKALVKLGKLF